MNYDTIMRFLSDSGFFIFLIPIFFTGMYLFKYFKSMISKVYKNFEDNESKSYVDYSPKPQEFNYQILNNIKFRLLMEIRESTIKSYINLGIGLFLSSAGIFFLFYLILTTNPETDMLKYSLNIVQKITFILFIELLAYFFLRLYKEMQYDIKYYHNEITNIDFKIYSLIVATDFSSIFKNKNNSNTDKTLLREILLEFSKTERNYILKKDESTIELEKRKFTASEFNDILKALMDFKNIKKSE